MVIRAQWLSSSVFGKLLGIMLVTAVLLLLIVTGFFAFIAVPASTSMTQSVLEEYARMFAAQSPGLGTARDIRSRLQIRVRYEGPGTNWTTDQDLPTVEQARRSGPRGVAGPFYHIQPAPGGGFYLFVWSPAELFHETHVKLFWLLLALILGVVVTAYHFQKCLLSPVRVLNDGVARLSAQELDVVLPVTTRDEFGALTEAFNSMVRRVREMIQARDQLLLDVSHELRSPLTRINVALALHPDDELKSEISADVREMESMITELLELERLREGRGVRCELQDVVPLIREVVRSCKGMPVEIRELDLPSSVLLNADSEKFRTVLRNVLENAAKYSLPDSHPVELFVEQSGEHTVIRVSDDGPGVPESDIPNLFEPFYRVDRSRSKKTGGYGLGLSICKRVMEAHGGSIAVRNNSGRGASFLLVFPTPGMENGRPFQAAVVRAER